MLAEAQAVASERAQAEEVARTVDRSMAAEFGADWARLTGAVSERIAADPSSVTSATDARAMLDSVEKVFLEVRRENDPSKDEWDRIRAASRDDGRYWYWRSKD